MSRHRIRHFLLAGGLIAFPLLLLGVAPALQDLIQRLDLLEGQVQALERASPPIEAELDLQPVAVDANGHRVGTVVTHMGVNPGVVLDIAGFELFRVTVKRDRVSSPGGNELHFESEDCTGPPLMIHWSDRLVPLPFIDETRDDIPIHLPDPDSTSAFQTITHSTFNPKLGCGSSSDSVRTFVPAVPVFVWQDEFTPPFRVVTRGEFLGMQEGGN